MVGGVEFIEKIFKQHCVRKTSEHWRFRLKVTNLKASTGLRKPTKGKQKTEVKDKILICLLVIFTLACRIS